MPMPSSPNMLKPRMTRLASTTSLNISIVRNVMELPLDSAIYSSGRNTPRPYIESAATCSIGITALNLPLYSNGRRIGMKRMKRTMSGDTMFIETSIWLFTVSFSLPPCVFIADRRG